MVFSIPFLLIKITGFSLIKPKESPEVPSDLAKVEDYWFYRKGVTESLFNNDDALWILKEGNCDSQHPKYPLMNLQIDLGEIESEKYKDSLVLNKLLDSASVDIMKCIKPKKCFEFLDIKYHYFDSTKTEAYSNFSKRYYIK